MRGLTQNDITFVNDTWEKLITKLRHVAVRSKDKLPYTAVNGVHDDMSEQEIQCWTNGFWPGLMWLMHIDSGEEIFASVAQHAEDMLDKAFEEYELLNHDMGFMWHISSGVNYRLTGSRHSKLRNLYAANLLMSRYNANGEFIRAWNAECYGWSIIDCMMNLPLLYWAGNELNDVRYASVAMKHADNALENHIRPDGSVNHIVVYDHINGGVIETRGGQGFGLNSSWSRGQAWALYGFVLSYIHTEKQEYLDAAKRVAHYFIANVCSDYLTRCDFRAPKEPCIYDSTAGVIAASGLIEISNCVPEYEKDTYLVPAIKLLRATKEKFSDFDINTDNILVGGTEEYHASEQRRHIPIIYGDYYFAEALYKLRGNEFLVW